jgi:hypothetical protein
MAQEPIPVTSLEEFPPTVEEHKSRNNGATLRTIDPDPDRNVEVYDGPTPPHFSGDDPEGYDD